MVELASLLGCLLRLVFSFRTCHGSPRASKPKQCSLGVSLSLSARGTQRRKPTSADQVGTGDDKILEYMVAVRQSTRQAAPGSKEDAQHG